METSETRKTFDFSKEKTQNITLAELEATYKENDVYGKPLGGIYHSDLINGISNMAREAGLEVEMGDLFAVNNLDGKRPGVALLPEVEEKEGERSIRAHLLRRVFAVIRLAAGGPNIHICRNQTILSAQQLIANYGYCRLDMDKKELAGADWWRPTVEGWITDVSNGVMQTQWADIIQSLDEQLLYRQDMQQIFGGLMQLRIEADTTEKTLRTGEVPPLTQSQINHCMERVLIKHFGKGGAGMCTKWDILNAMTDTLKPLNDSDGRRVPGCDTSRLLPQLARCVEFLL